MKYWTTHGHNGGLPLAVVLPTRISSNLVTIDEYRCRLWALERSKAGVTVGPLCSTNELNCPRATSRSGDWAILAYLKMPVLPWRTLVSGGRHVLRILPTPNPLSLRAFSTSSRLYVEGLTR